MKDIRTRMTSKEIIEMFDENAVVNAILLDRFYTEEAANMIRSEIPTFDKEDQEFYGDLNNDTILIRAFVDNCSAGELVHLMLENGFSHDLVCLLEEQYGLDDE